MNVQEIPPAHPITQTPIPEAPDDPPLDELLRGRPPVLIFLPNTNELQRFVLSGAFAEVGRRHPFHYVLPEQDAEKMFRAAPALSRADTSVLRMPPERFKTWASLFQAACVHYARISPSFAIRANLTPPPVDADLAEMTEEERAVLDSQFAPVMAGILKDLQPMPEILALLDRLRPIFCIVPTSLLDAFCNDVAWACATNGVLCVLLQSGWDNLSSKGLLPFQTPYLGCWGHQSFLHARIIQRIQRRQLGTLGAPHYEFLKPAAAGDVRRLRTELGVSEGVRLVLFGGSFRQFDETTILRRLERVIARGRLERTRIVYRPHPWRAARQHEDSFFRYQWEHVIFDPDMRERYVNEQAAPGYIKQNVPMFDMEYLSLLISACDAVISPMSTLLLEALILEKPTMAIAFGDDKHSHNPSVTARMTHFDGLRSSPAIIWCDSSEELADDCRKLLRHKPTANVAKARRKLLGEVVTRAPGTYAQRLAAFCREFEVRARKLRAQRTHANRGTISHAYGADLIARAYCQAPASVQVPGYWMHGWIPAYHNIDPALIALHKKEGQDDDHDYEAQIRDEKADTPQWVSRSDQAAYLRADGYRHVEAIGLPIVYMPPADVRRIPGSLLVLPPHSHKIHGPDDPIAERYGSMIADMHSRFAHVWVGVNEDDIRHNQWIESFERRGISVFTTTDQSDPQTLYRLRRLLSMFEYVTTNGFGSHIAFAAYCGARISIYGPFAEFPLERMRLTHAVKMFPRLVEQAHYLCTEEALRRHYPFLFVEPDQAPLCQQWGAEEVGEPCRVTPDDLARLFGWHRRAGQLDAMAARSGDR